MKPNRLLRAANRLLVPSSFAALLAIAPHLQAQTTGTWSATAANGNWSDAANWNAQPGATTGTSNIDTAVFNTSTSTTITVDAGRNIQNVTFGGGSTFNLTGSTLLLTNGGKIYCNGSAVDERISAPLQIQGGSGSTYTIETITPGTNREIQLSGAITGTATAAGSTTLTLTGNSGGANEVMAAGSISDGTAGGNLAVVKEGTGLWVFGGNNSYSGGTTVKAGTLRVSGNGNTTTRIGTGPLTFDGSGATLRLQSTSATTLNNDVVVGAGGGTLSNRTNNFFSPASMGGTGVLTLTGDNGLLITTNDLKDFAGTVRVTGGTGFALRLGNTFVDTSMQNAALHLDTAGSLTRQNGTNATIITNIGTLSGVAGTSVGGSTAGSGVFVYSVGGRNEDSTFAGVIANGGTATGLTKVGTGTLTLSGNNTYTGATAIEDGKLAIGAGGTTGTLGTGQVTLSGTAQLEFNRSDTLAVANTITGTGTVVKNGAGILALSGDNTYFGDTILNAGTLVLSNTTGSATSSGVVEVNAGALGGTGTASGPVNIDSGAAVRPGNVTASLTEVGTLTTGDLTLAGGSTLFVEFESVSSYDTIVAGALATSGASAGNPVLVDLRVENSPSKWATLGTYNLIQYTGTFSGDPNDLFEVTPSSQQAGFAYTFGTSGGFLTLTIAGVAPSEWNVDADGNWSAGSNWLNGVPNAVGATANFASVISSPRTVTLDGARTVGTINFNNANTYTLAGSALTLDASSGNASIEVINGDHAISAPIGLSDALDLTLATAGDSLDLSGLISGAGGIAKSSPGDLNLGGNNSFTGSVSFSNGTLGFSSGGLGDGSNLSLSSATLAWNSGNTDDISDRTINLSSGSVTFNTGANNVTLANTVGGGGTAALVKSGGGSLTLAADATYSGGTTISEGSLVLGTGGSTGLVSGGIVNNATLAVNLADGSSVANLISGTGSLIHQGTGSLGLSAANSFSGTTTIPNAGATLQLGNSLALQNSTLASSSTGGTLDFGFLTTATLGALSGDGDIVLDNLSPAPVALTVGGNGASTTYNGALSGSGSFTKTGAGVMTLGNLSTISGSTSVSGGQLVVPAGAGLTSSGTTLANAASLWIDGGDVVTGSVTLGATNPQCVVQLSSGTLQVSGAISATGSNGSTSSGLILVEGGTLTAGSISLGRTGLIYTAEPTTTGTDMFNYIQTGGTANITGDFNIGTVAAANSSVISRIDGGILTVNGSVVVALNNGGRWSALDLNGGELVVPSTTTGLLLGGPNAGSAAFLARFGYATLGRVQFGQAGNGTGVFNLSGAEVYIGSGGMVQGPNPSFVPSIKLNSGTLGAADDWSTSLGMVLGGDVNLKAADFGGSPHDYSVSGALSGFGSITKTGGGTITLGGVNTYAGNTTVQEGTLSLSSASLSNTHDLDVWDAATLNLTHGANDIVGRFLIEGIEQASGTYGAIGSGAQYETARITGTGRIVVPGADPYADWASGFGLAGGNADKGADPDNDGRLNLLEFATNDDPTSPLASGKVRARVENVSGNDVLVLTLPVRAGAAFSGVTAQDATIDNLTYSIEGSDDVDEWNLVISEVTPALTANPAMPALDAGWTYRTFRTPGNVTSDPEDFIRLKVTAP